MKSRYKYLYLRYPIFLLFTIYFSVNLYFSLNNLADVDKATFIFCFFTLILSIIFWKITRMATLTIRSVLGIITIFLIVVSVWFKEYAVKEGLFISEVHYTDSFRYK